MAPGLLVAAPRSGSGKTIVTIGLQRAWRRQGLVVRGAKSGPDYIDPAFHAAATGEPGVNLDSFAMAPAQIAALAAAAALGADLVVAEGAMGLYDGLALPERNGSCAELATQLGWPVVLVIDASGAAQTAAAIAHGCATMPGAPRIAGVILNKVASPRHRRLAEARFAEVGIRLFGAIAPAPALALPERHLGLVQAGETGDLDARLDAIAAHVAASVDLDALRAAAGETRPAAAAAAGAGIRPIGQRIAVARDAAFAFLYPHLLTGWRAAGAEIRFFSPLADEAPPADCDGCWLPGGYPELHAGRLAANRTLLEGLRGFAATRPVHGECGGYMLLGESLEDAEGVTHAMAGLLPVATSFARRKLHLGYRQAELVCDTGFAPRGTCFRGHEYHYASITGGAPATLATMRDGEGVALPAAGHVRGRVSGSFFHLVG